jgi:hypothetical protein
MIQTQVNRDVAFQGQRRRYFAFLTGTGRAKGLYF